MYNCFLHLLLVFLSKPVLSFQILMNLFDFVSHIFIVGHTIDTHALTHMFVHECTYPYIHTIKDKSLQKEGLL